MFFAICLKQEILLEKLLGRRLASSRCSLVFLDFFMSSIFRFLYFLILVLLSPSFVHSLCTEVYSLFLCSKRSYFLCNTISVTSISIFYTCLSSCSMVFQPLLSLNLMKQCVYLKRRLLSWM